MSKQIVTIQIEVYDSSSNIRTDFESKEFTADINEEKYHQTVKVPKETVDMEIKPTNTNAEFLIIMTDIPIKIKLNDTGSTQMLINEYFAISSDNLDKIYVSNESTTDDAVIIVYFANVS